MLLRRSPCSPGGAAAGRRAQAPVPSRRSLPSPRCSPWWSTTATSGETYRDQFARISGELGRPAAESDPGGRSVAGATGRCAAQHPHLLRVPGHRCWPRRVPAWLWRRQQRDRLALTLSGWAVGCGAFLVLGVLTPVDMRLLPGVLPGGGHPRRRSARRGCGAPARRHGPPRSRCSRGSSRGACGSGWCR